MPFGGGKGGKGSGGLGTITVDTNSTSNLVADTTSKVELVGLDNIGIKSSLDSRSDLKLAITEPIRTDATNRLEMDIKPIEADLCFRVEFGGLPPSKICRPFDHHFGITLFGVEIFGFNYVGERRTVIEDLPRRAQVVGLNVQDQPREKKVRIPVRVGGLNIRLDP